MVDLHNSWTRKTAAQMEIPMTIFNEGGSPPPPPSVEDAGWEHVLIWCLTVMDDDDTSMPFISGCLSFYTKPYGAGRLTDRQERGCERVFRRLIVDFEHQQLDCQNVEPADA